MNEGLEDRVMIVNGENAEIGAKKRKDVTPEEYFRVSALWLSAPDEYILLARRSEDKQHHPGMMGPAVTGTIEPHESYDHAIVRETKEELGLNLVEAQVHGIRLLEDDYKYFTRFYSSRIPKNTVFTPKKDEVIGLTWYQPDDLRAALESNPGEYTPVVHHFAELLSLTKRKKVATLQEKGLVGGSSRV